MTTARALLADSEPLVRRQRELQRAYILFTSGSTGRPTRDPFAAGLATRTLTGHLPSDTRIDKAAVPPSPAVVLSAQLQQYYHRLRLPPRRTTHFPVWPVIKRAAPTTKSADHRAGDGLPCSMTTSESWATCAAFIGSSISWLGAGVWQQHHSLPGARCDTSVDWPLAVVLEICGTGRYRFHRAGRQAISPEHPCWPLHFWGGS